MILISDIAMSWSLSEKRDEEEVRALQTHLKIDSNGVDILYAIKHGLGYV